MTFEELLIACSSGKMPMVEIKTPVKNSKVKRGNIVTIKKDGMYHGCAVRFWDIGYNTWFYADPNGTDRRSQYMRDLTLVNEDKEEKEFRKAENKYYS